MPNPSQFINRCKQKVLDTFSTVDFKDNRETIKKLNDRTKKMSNPAINRAIMGVTALALQPPIDYSNKAVDKETRRISVCRTVAKIIAGMLVGIVVRGSAHKLVEKLTNVEAKNLARKRLIPKSFIDTFAKDPDRLNTFRSAVSTGTAILAMCFTNFAIDAPLTIYLTNKFKALTERKESNLDKISPQKEVNNE